MYNFSKFDNFSTNKSKSKISNQKQQIKYQKTALQLSPWEYDAVHYLTGQIQSEFPYKNQDSNRDNATVKINNEKRCASQHYNRDGRKKQKKQMIQVEPYVNKFQQVLVQRCRSSSLCKNNKSAVIFSNPKEKNNERGEIPTSPLKQSKLKVSQNPEINSEQSPAANKQKIFQYSQSKQAIAFKNVVNTTYLTFYDEPSFTPFEKNRKKLSNYKKNFYTIESETKESKKQSTSFKNFENFLKMKKLQKFQSLIKQNQDPEILRKPLEQNFISHCPQKNQIETPSHVSQTQASLARPQKVDNNKKVIGKMFQITQIPREKFNLYIKTQQVSTKKFKKNQQINLFKLQKESQCLLRMKSEPSSPIKKRNQRLYTTQTVINVKGQQSVHGSSPTKLKKMISTNIQKIRVNLKMIRDSERYKKLDKTIIQIQGGKYFQQK